MCNLNIGSMGICLIWGYAVCIVTEGIVCIPNDVLFRLLIVNNEYSKFKGFAFLEYQ